MFKNTFSVCFILVYHLTFETTPKVMPISVGKKKKVVIYGDLFGRPKCRLQLLLRIFTKYTNEGETNEIKISKN